MKRFSARLVVTIGLLLTMALPARADINLEFHDTATTLNEELADYLADSGVITDFLAMIESNFLFEEALTVVIGAEGAPGYQSDTRTLNLPYAWFADAVRAQVELVDEGEEKLAVSRALDVYEYAAYHLLGHALINNASVDEDAIAEALSTWIMVKAWPNGAEQWMSDTRALADASQKLDGAADEFWHAHGLYKIREQTIECWLYGSDPDGLESLMPAVLDDNERRIRCVQSWQRLENAVASLLDRQLKADAPLREHLPELP